MPTMLEEIYQFVHKSEKQTSIHLENFFKKSNFDPKLNEKWTEFFDVKNSVYQLIEQKIQSKEINRSNEIAVVLDSNSSNFLKSLDLVKLLMVAKVEFKDQISIYSLNWPKCPRCWNHFEKIQDVCDRCFEVLNENKN